MRSGFTTTQLEAGVDLLAVANMTGHRTMASDGPPVLSSRQICSPVPPDRNVPWEKQSDESPLLAYSVEKLAIWLAAGSGGLAGSVILSPGEMEKWARKRP